MFFKALAGISIPFIGTALGAGCVFFLQKEMGNKLEKAICGFAAGVMTAASVWSLLIPAMELSSDLGRLSFAPAVSGMVFGFVFLFVFERLVYRLEHKNKSMLVFSVNLHNLPEGMAVGIIYAGWLAGIEVLSYSAALAVSLGIAIQNIPEGAIVSMSLYSKGLSKSKSFVKGLLSALIEPVGALMTIVLYSVITSALPFLLGFAAGAMLHVVYNELIPQARHSDAGELMFAMGFSLMMMLDVVFS